MVRFYLVATKVIVFFSAIFILQSVTLQALANSPPNLPLPPCIVVDGEETGACLNEDYLVSGSASGEFGEGSTVAVRTNPEPGICITNWAPNPCFAGVSQPSLGTCGVIDLLDDGKFKEMSC